MSRPSARGLPARIAVPLFAAFALCFLGVMAYLIAIGFGVTGSVFGAAAKHAGGTAPAQGSTAAVQGGPPPAVAAQLRTLQQRVAAHPDDDVALTQLGDMYLAANRFTQAIPYYRRALRANPHNVAARAGLSEARDALSQAPR